MPRAPPAPAGSGHRRPPRRRPRARAAGDPRAGRAPAGDGAVKAASARATTAGPASRLPCTETPGARSCPLPVERPAPGEGGGRVLEAERGDAVLAKPRGVDARESNRIRRTRPPRSRPAGSRRRPAARRRGRGPRGCTSPVQRSRRARARAPRSHADCAMQEAPATPTSRVVAVDGDDAPGGARADRTQNCDESEPEGCGAARGPATGSRRRLRAADRRRSARTRRAPARARGSRRRRACGSRRSRAWSRPALPSRVELACAGSRRSSPASPAWSART